MPLRDFSQQGREQTQQDNKVPLRVEIGFNDTALAWVLPLQPT
jgi:hypothetical protein